MNQTSGFELIQAQLDAMGLGELVAIGIAITAFSGSFYFVWGIISPWLDRLYTAIKRLTFYEIEVYLADEDYYKFNLWLDENRQYTRFQRTFKPVHDRENSKLYDEPAEKGQTKLVSGYGSVLIKAPKTPWVLVTRSVEENKQVLERTDILKFKIFALREQAVFDFYDKVTNINEEQCARVYRSAGSYWHQDGRPKHVLEPLGQGCDEFIRDVEQFLNSEQSYRSRGIPYKRGYLLYGMPGTGKTSLLAYLANKHNMNVYIVSSDAIRNFSSMVTDIKPNSIVLIEDIDMTTLGEKRNGLVHEPTSTSALDDDTDGENPFASLVTNKDVIREFLNALDGITEFGGSIIVATTNKPDVLDAALLRPGRIDKQIEIGPLTAEQQIRHVNRFFQIVLDPNDYSDLEPRTFAQLQDLCVRHMDDPDSAIKALR